METTEPETELELLRKIEDAARGNFDSGFLTHDGGLDKFRRLRQALDAYTRFRAKPAAHETEQPELRQPWWSAECELVKDYMPPYPRDTTKPKFVVKHTPTNQFLRYSKGPRQGHFWDGHGDDYHNENLARLAISQAPPPPKVTVLPAVEEIEAWRAELDFQRVEIEGLQQQVKDRDATIKYLRRLLAEVNATVRGHEGREDGR